MTDEELIAAMLNAYEREKYYLAPNMRMRTVLNMVRLHDATHRPAGTEKPRRVPVQIAGIGDEIFALANDGRIYVGENKPAFAWQGRLPDLPQD